jgi:hypothetical protein
MDTFMRAHKRFKQRGVALAIAYMVVGALVTLSSGFIASTVGELRTAQYYNNSTKAFWVASSGINQFMKDPAYLDAGSKTITVGSNTVLLSKTDGATERVVRAESTVSGTKRTIEITYPSNPPGLFSNTMTSGNNFNLTGLLARLDVYGKTRIGGSYNQSGFLAVAYFEDRQTGQGTASTTLRYPDANGNGVSDEFADFKRFYQDECNLYTPTEVEHVVVNSGDSVILYPNKKNVGKRLIFVEGPNPGDGSIDIIFDAAWRSSENLTIVSTGDVNYIEPLQLGVNSKLNIVAWQDYNEASILYSAHSGVTYAHDDANYYSVLNYSVTKGNVIANDNINAMEALTWKRFNYESPFDAQGSAPPGFSGLIGQATAGYVTTPSSWREI